MKPLARLLSNIPAKKDQRSLAVSWWIIEGQWSHATSYLIVKDAGRLKLLWTGVAPVFSAPGTELSVKTNELVTAELEKRMKSRKLKK